MIHASSRFNAIAPISKPTPKQHRSDTRPLSFSAAAHKHADECSCSTHDHHHHAHKHSDHKSKHHNQPGWLTKVTSWFKRLFSTVIQDIKALWARLTGKHS